VALFVIPTKDAFQCRRIFLKHIEKHTISKGLLQ